MHCRTKMVVAMMTRNREDGERVMRLGFIGVSI